MTFIGFGLRKIASSFKSNSCCTIALLNFSSYPSIALRSSYILSPYLLVANKHFFKSSLFRIRLSKLFSIAGF